VDKIVAQAQQAEADGFSSLWYASSVAGDPLVAMAIHAIRCCKPIGSQPWSMPWEEPVSFWDSAAHTGAAE
jgi:hypothetical protein